METVTLPPDLLALIRRGLSCIVGSRDAQLRPSVMRAVGSRVSDDGREITVFLSRPQSRQLLQDIAACGQLSVVFGQPSTHRTVQLKATRATQRAATEADRPTLQAYLAAMEVEIASIGFPPEYTRAMFSHDLTEVVAVTFSPEQAFEQTPGPRAGTRLGAA
jgi:hypothetical protein